MSSLTDRYVHAVTEQLPPGQRDDIERELRGTIEDSITGAGPVDDRREAERRTLLDLGPPSLLADGYRGGGRYLIGPRLYDQWLRTVKALLSFVPAIAAVVVLAIGVVEGDTIVEVIAGALSAAFSAALQVLFWVTLGFTVAERTGADVGLPTGVADEEAWDPDDLPEPRRRQVTWGDAIVTLVLNAVMLVLLLGPWRIGGSIEGYQLSPVFTDTAYSLRWVLAVGVAVSLVSSIVVLARGRWTWPAATANAVGNLVFLAPILWLAARDELFDWATLPSWLSLEDGRTLRVNEPVTLWGTVALVAAVVVWDIVDGLWKASRRP